MVRKSYLSFEVNLIVKERILIFRMKHLNKPYHEIICQYLIGTSLPYKSYRYWPFHCYVKVVVCIIFQDENLAWIPFLSLPIHVNHSVVVFYYKHILVVQIFLYFVLT
jgi:hypothetical protein